MSVFTGKITGSIGLFKKLEKLQSVALTAQRNAVKEIVLLVHSNAVKSIQDNGDGVKQTRYDPYREVNVSDPGEPPNSDTGRLARSIKFEFEKDGMVGRVGTNLKYGAHLEFGTKDMDARPWLQPAVEEASKEANKIMKDNIEEQIKGVSK